MVSSANPSHKGANSIFPYQKKQNPGALFSDDVKSERGLLYESERVLIKNPNWGGRRPLPPDGGRKKYSLYLSQGEHEAVMLTLKKYRDMLRVQQSNESEKETWVPQPFGKS